MNSDKITLSMMAAFIMAMIILKFTYNIIGNGFNNYYAAVNNNAKYGKPIEYKE